MADAHAHDDGHHGDKRFRLYMVIAVALAVFTAMSFVVNQFISHNNPRLGFMIILGVAVVKATLVGAYFMHLTFDWGKLYFLLIPAFVLAVMMMIVLLPDIVIDWHVPDITNP